MGIPPQDERSCTCDGVHEDVDPLCDLNLPDVPAPPQDGDEIETAFRDIDTYLCLDNPFIGESALQGKAQRALHSISRRLTEVSEERDALARLYDWSQAGANEAARQLATTERALTEVSEERDIYYWELNDPRGALTESRERVERLEGWMKIVAQVLLNQVRIELSDEEWVAFSEAAALSTPDSEES